MTSKMGHLDRFWSDALSRYAMHAFISLKGIHLHVKNFRPAVKQQG